MSEPLRVADRRPERGDKIVSETLHVMVSNAAELADEVIMVSDKGLVLRDTAGKTWPLPWLRARMAVYVHRADGGPLEKGGDDANG